MKELLVAFVGLFLSSISGHAATLLANFDGNATPASQGWGTVPSTTTIVVGQNVVEDGRPVYKITDPGGAAGYLYHNKSVSAVDTDSMFSQGWEMSIKLKVPEIAGLGDWSQDRGITIGFSRGVTGDRIFYSLIFGRDASGATRVSIYGPNTLKLISTSGFHEYTVRYLPGDTAAKVYIDGEYWADMPGTSLNSPGTSSIFWGDNAQSVVPSERYAFYEHVHLMIIPEPQKILLCGFAAIFLIFRRRRK